MKLSFGEQIKIILKRNHLTIQDLCDLYEASTGSKMSRQNLSQRLRRDNFSEQDMHTLASLLGYDVSIQLTPASVTSSENILPVKTATPSGTSKPGKKEITNVNGSTFVIPDLLPNKTPVLGEINPLTGQEYLTNTVRQHPSLSDYLQVYDRSSHSWNDVNEDYFWKFQANKKEILGSDYQEPIVI